MKHNVTNAILMIMTIAVLNIWLDMRQWRETPREVVITLDWGIAIEDTQFPPLPVRKVR